MRAACESCAKPQPADWRQGDLCVHCGLAVREETRCFWCASWVPAAKFCRKCGSATVSTENYGPARMLKHMGASAFEVPKLLAELDPELIATHRAIYTSHAAAANRHVDTARTLSEHLYQKHWAAQVENELIPQLPAPIQPPLLLHELTLLAQVQQGDFSNLRESANLIHHPDPAIAAEAALHFSGWRALYCTHTEINRHQLIAVLRQSPLPIHAAPRLAALGAEPRPQYGITGDADTDFLVSILDESIHALEENLTSSDPQRRYVAASHLIRFRRAASIGPALRAAGEADQLQLLRDIVRYKTPVPALHDDLFALVNNSTEDRICQAAVQVIAFARRHGEFVRLSGGDAATIHTLFRAMPAPETFLEIGWRLVQSGRFDAGQWGMDDAAKPGAMPIHFVEDLYPHASPKVRGQLLRFAEKQIEAHGEQGSRLERFLIRQCFASAATELIGAAWASIHRIQMHRQVGLTVPCDLSLANVAWCWTMPELLTAIAALMANPAAVKQTFVRDDFDRFLRSAEPDFFTAAAAFPHECRHVIESALLADPYIYAVQFAAALQITMEV